MIPDVERLFDKLADLDAAARESYFIRHATDPAIRQEVESLLAHDRTSSASLVMPIMKLAASALPASGTADSRRCGPYELIQLIGRGGMGTVFRAARVDGEVRQQVAVKLMQEGFQQSVAATAVLAGAPDTGGPVASEHRRPFGRRPLRGGAALFRHGTGGRQAHRRILRGTVSAPKDRELSASLRCRIVRAQQIGGAPGYQAGQHSDDARRRAQAAGFRHRQDAGHRWRRHAHVAARDDSGLWQPRTGHWWRGHYRDRYLFVGSGAIQNAHRTRAPRARRRNARGHAGGGAHTRRPAG